MEMLGIILAGGRGSRLDILSYHRAKPGVPFAGKFRIIDFALSNCVNSGIYDIAILTQYLPLSLNEHIGMGNPWDLDRKNAGVTLLQPYTGLSKKGWYMGTADAVLQNLRYLKRKNPKYTLILSGDHVYKMDYKKMLDFHKKNGASLTIASQRVPMEDAHRFGLLEYNDNMKIEAFKEKPENPTTNLASMGIYIFNTDVLIKKLEENRDIPELDFGKHIIPGMINEDEVYAYEFEGYWQDVGTYDSYWEANLALTESYEKIELDMYDKDWLIQTRSEEKPGVKFGINTKAVQSIICNGCIITGEVEKSVLGPGVVVEPGAVVKNSIIFNDTVIKKGAIIDRAIIDKEVVIGENCKIGYGDDMTPNEEKPKLLSSGLTVIAKGVKVPSNTIIGRNCRIFSKVKEEAFSSGNIKSGTTIEPLEKTED
ncbi:glucose-1-phosphate adenylyltransferase [Haliovirga abyssi]|uniref:Glucose-1-phosphate adenylyltransferase n=1 Tax=Haliovirga abyssi TaxID=2996794 RepID=A0AAU9DJ50_9FUSO|nr:glucose-1-phosphate adenylyltransferase [Haliovirga abyssi]BDU49872.1 glucose-1-phosphate adenylyltransferase [Haliovirga abyssi]